MLLVGLFLRINLTLQTELKPLSIEIGRGDSSVPIAAYYSHTYRGWPLRWEEREQTSTEKIAWNAGTAVGLTLLAAVLCEVWMRFRRRVHARHDDRVRVAGLPIRFAAGLLMLIAAVGMGWQNRVLVPEGPFAVRGWPLRYEAFVRVEAVITPEDIQAWDRVADQSSASFAGNVALVLVMLMGIALAARTYEVRALRRSRETPAQHPLDEG
jgi:hypothetical protein